PFRHENVDGRLVLSLGRDINLFARPRANDRRDFQRRHLVTGLRPGRNVRGRHTSQGKSNREQSGLHGLLLTVLPAGTDREITLTTGSIAAVASRGSPAPPRPRRTPGRNWSWRTRRHR